MNLFEEAMLEVNEDPSQMTLEGYDLLYDLFKHLGDGGTIYNNPHPELTSDVSVIFMAICLQTVARELASQVMKGEEDDEY